MVEAMKTNKPKKHFYILLNGNKVGDSWAVSSEKARANFWWRNVKNGDEYSPREYDPEDFDVIEA